MKNVLAFILALLLLSTSVAGAQAKSAFGVNLDQACDWSPQVPFINEVKSARPFGSPAKPYDAASAPALDANGYPKGDFGVVIGTARPIWPGTHKVIAKGKVSQIKLVASSGTVQNLTYDAGTNTTRADVVVPSGSTQLMLGFIGAPTGVQDLKVLCPGYADDSNIFTGEFLKALEAFGCIRFMPILDINSANVVRWDDRTQYADARWSDKGVPYEVVVQLGMKTHKNLWINVFDGADDDHIRKLATFCHDNLPSDVNVYLEHSNEVWNYQFPQAKRNLNAAKTEVVAGDPHHYNVTVVTKKVDGSRTSVAPSEDLYRHYRHAYRSYLIGKVFREVFGPDAARVRPILAVQGANPWFHYASLAWVESQIGKPSDVFYGLAVAPYYGTGNDALLKEPAATPQKISDYLLTTGLNSLSGATLTEYRQICRNYGLRVVAYEGGVDLNQYDINVANKAAAQFLTNTGRADDAYFSNWYSKGGDEFNQFELCSPYVKSGYWGLTNDIRNINTPRFQAAVKNAKSHLLADEVLPPPITQPTTKPDIPPTQPVPPFESPEVKALKIQITILSEQMNDLNAKLDKAMKAVGDAKAALDTAQ